MRRRRGTGLDRGGWSRGLKHNADRGAYIFDDGAARGTGMLAYAERRSGLIVQGDHAVVVAPSPGKGDLHSTRTLRGEGIRTLHLRGHDVAEALLVGTTRGWRVFKPHPGRRCLRMCAGAAEQHRKGKEQRGESHTRTPTLPDSPARRYSSRAVIGREAQSVRAKLPRRKHASVEGGAWQDYDGMLGLRGRRRRETMPSRQPQGAGDKTTILNRSEGVSLRSACGSGLQPALVGPRGALVDPCGAFRR
jgi:hypothetical protein